MIKVVRERRYGAGEAHVSSVELVRKETDSRAMQVAFSLPCTRALDLQYTHASTHPSGFC